MRTHMRSVALSLHLMMFFCKIAASPQTTANDVYNRTNTTGGWRMNNRRSTSERGREVFGISANWWQALDRYRASKSPPNTPNDSPSFVAQKRKPFAEHQYDSQNWMQDGLPFVYHDATLKKTAVLCFSEKVGSTTWKQVMWKSYFRPGYALNKNAEEDEGMLTKHMLSGNAHSFMWKGKEEKFAHETGLFMGDVDSHSRTIPNLKQATENPNVPRIMLVRDPFRRFVSGFIEKILMEHRYRSVISVYALACATNKTLAFCWLASPYLDASIRTL